VNRDESAIVTDAVGHSQEETLLMMVDFALERPPRRHETPERPHAIASGWPAAAFPAIMMNDFRGDFGTLPMPWRRPPAYVTATAATTRRRSGRRDLRVAKSLDAFITR